MKKRWIAGLSAITLTGGLFFASIEGDPVPEDHGDLANVQIIVNTGGQARHTLGKAIWVDKTMLHEFSDIEKGIADPEGTDVRTAVRAFAVTEAESNSVNANCNCFMVDNVNEPTKLISIP